MASEPTNLKRTSSFNSEGHGESQKRQDREVRDMISSVTRRLTDLQSMTKHGSSQWGDKDDEGGVRIITLAGSNTGATMRADLSEILDTHHGGKLTDSSGDHEALGAYTNSNFQAVNNAILLEASCSSSDPGVHIVISDHYEGRGLHLDGHEKKKRDKSGEEKHREKRSDGEP